jgi:microcystin-dependent protein
MDPFVGEIRLFGGNYAPEGWLLCNGATVSVNTYQVLFALIGTAYGGDGVSNFALPDLRGRVPIGSGQGPGLQNYALASHGGSQTQSLSVANLTNHTHPIYVSSTGVSTSTPGATVTFGSLADPMRFYVDTSKTVTGTNNFSNQAISSVGGGQAHNNTMPLLAMSYIICWQGIFPDFQ